MLLRAQTIKQSQIRVQPEKVIKTDDKLCYCSRTSKKKNKTAFTTDNWW